MVRITVICIAFAALIFVLYLLFSNSQKPWNEMTENEQQRKKAMIVGGTLVLLAGMIAAFFPGKKK
jgi:Na+/H+ antiporter NhaD/arsenite permease-like protein